MNTPTTFELKQIAETFFKEKGTFSIDNVLGLMKAAFEAGYAKGNAVSKFYNTLAPIKSFSAPDLNADPNFWSQNQWQCDSVVPNADKLPGLNSDPLNAIKLNEALASLNLPKFP